MFNKKIEEAFNKQINHEFYAAYLYLSIAADFEKKNLKGFSHWMRLQAKEELSHGMKFFDYIIERGGEVKLTEIKTPTANWANPIEAFQEASNHEALVTKKINNLVNLIDVEKDPASLPFLQWFLNEQVEEESSALQILSKLKMIKEEGSALLMLDNELGARSE